MEIASVVLPLLMGVGLDVISEKLSLWADVGKADVSVVLSL